MVSDLASLQFNRWKHTEPSKSLTHIHRDEYPKLYVDTESSKGGRFKTELLNKLCSNEPTDDDPVLIHLDTSEFNSLLPYMNEPSNKEESL